MNRRSAAALLAALFASCSSPHANGGFVPGALSSPGAASRHRARSSVRLVIHIPRHRRRTPLYVSPNTQSATIAIGPVKLSVGLAASSANCSNAPAGLTCSVAMALAPGTYSGSITLYDGALNGSGQPTGNVLSLNQGFPVKVVAGQSNVPSITLDGVPAGMTFLPLTPSTIVANGTSFEMIGAGSSARIAAYAIDPDGNVIVGPGAPTFSAAATGGFTASGNGSVIELTAPAHFASGLSSLSIAAVSPACAQPQAVCSFKVTIAFLPLVAVASSGDNAVIIVRPFVGGLYAVITNGISGPAAIAFDSNGNLFVGNQIAETVTKYVPPYTGPPSVTLNVHNGYKPASIAVAPSGTLAISDDHGDVVTYAASTYAQIGILNTNYNATQVSFDASNNLWIDPNEISGYGVERYPAPAYATANVQLTTNSVPESIAFDAAQNAYVGYGGGGAVVQYSAPSYLPGAHVVGLPPLPPSAVAADGAIGALAVCTSTGLNVYSMTSLSLVSENAASSYCAPAFDRDADVWTIYPTLGIVAGYKPIGTSWVPLEVFPANQPTAIAAFPGP